MKESPFNFNKRTGVTYEPPPLLRGLARPLRPREACPTLFRYPGPEALRDLLLGGLKRLGPAGREWVWLASDIVSGYPGAVDSFGTVAILEPLALNPCATKHRGIYLGLNLEIGEGSAYAESVTWVPPSAVRARARWDDILTAAEAVRRFGARYAEERAAVGDRLNAYLEELSELRRVAAPGPKVPWCEVRASERRKVLERHGVKPRWTAP